MEKSYIWSGAVREDFQRKWYWSCQSQEEEGAGRHRDLEQASNSCALETVTSLLYVGTGHVAGEQS